MKIDTLLRMTGVLVTVLGLVLIFNDIFRVVPPWWMGAIIMAVGFSMMRIRNK